MIYKTGNELHTKRRRAAFDYHPVFSRLSEHLLQGQWHQ